MRWIGKDKNWVKTILSLSSQVNPNAVLKEAALKVNAFTSVSIAH